MTEVSAKLSRFKSSASKIRLLADQIRGKKVDEALDILTFSPKSGSRNLKKLLDIYEKVILQMLWKRLKILNGLEAIKKKKQKALLKEYMILIAC